MDLIKQVRQVIWDSTPSVVARKSMVKDAHLETLSKAADAFELSTIQNIHKLTKTIEKISNALQQRPIKMRVDDYNLLLEAMEVLVEQQIKSNL